MQLRSFYAAPSVIVLAFDDAGAAGGVVALLVSGPVGEIRRLYVAPGQRTGGLGRRLTEALISHSRALGLERLVLTTLPTMIHAQALYRSLGFEQVDPYVDEPTDGVLYFALNLA